MVRRLLHSSFMRPSWLLASVLAITSPPVPVDRCPCPAESLCLSGRSASRWRLGLASVDLSPVGAYDGRCLLVGRRAATSNPTAESLGFAASALVIASGQNLFKRTGGEVSRWQLEGSRFCCGVCMAQVVTGCPGKGLPVGICRFFRRCG